MERIKLNLIPSGVAPVVHVSQYDDGREFAIDLYDGENVYVLDGTETLTVNVRKPDGHLVTEAVTNTSDSYVVISTTEQMTAVHGTNYAKLQIVKGGVTIATLEFLMSVSRDPLENGDPSESFVHNLETQIALAVADQYDSNNVIFDANPTAGHGVGYAVTSEGVKNADDAVVALIPTDLDDLADVTYTGTPASGEVLEWDGTKWTNTAIKLDDITDVNVTGATDGQALCYDANADEWVPVGVASYGDSLPMSSSDPDTVAYRITNIENNLPTTTTGTVTQDTNTTILRSSLVKYGNVKTLSIIFQLNNSSATAIGTLSSGYAPQNNIDFNVVSDNGAILRLRIQSNSTTISISNGYGSTTGTYFSFAIAYI